LLRHENPGADQSAKLPSAGFLREIKFAINIQKYFSLSTVNFQIDKKESSFLGLPGFD